jgi:translation initiation factor IF-3
VTADHLVNEYITSREVRLVNEEENKIVATREALYQARQQNLDLVVIRDASPPIAKILNYGKFRYDQEKREKEIAKKSRAAQVDVKEIQLRPVTDVRDVELKAKKAQGFLTDGDKVKVIVKFKGRELNYADRGRTVLENFLKNLSEHKVEKPITLSGRDMMTIVAPLKTTTS